MALAFIKEIPDYIGLHTSEALSHAQGSTETSSPTSGLKTFNPPQEPDVSKNGTKTSTEPFPSSLIHYKKFTPGSECGSSLPGNRYQEKQRTQGNEKTSTVPGMWRMISQTAGRGETGPLWNREVLRFWDRWEGGRKIQVRRSNLFNNNNNKPVLKTLQ